MGLTLEQGESMALTSVGTVAGYSPMTFSIRDYLECRSGNYFPYKSYFCRQMLYFKVSDLKLGCSTFFSSLLSFLVLAKHLVFSDLREGR